MSSLHGAEHHHKWLLKDLIHSPNTEQLFFFANLLNLSLNWFGNMPHVKLQINTFFIFYKIFVARNMPVHGQLFHINNSHCRYFKFSIIPNFSILFEFLASDTWVTLNDKIYTCNILCYELDNYIVRYHNSTQSCNLAFCITLELSNFQKSLITVCKSLCWIL